MHCTRQISRLCRVEMLRSNYQTNWVIENTAVICCLIPDLFTNHELTNITIEIHKPSCILWGGSDENNYQFICTDFGSEVLNNKKSWSRVAKTCLFWQFTAYCSCSWICEYHKMTCNIDSKEQWNTQNILTLYQIQLTILETIFLLFMYIDMTLV